VSGATVRRIDRRPARKPAPRTVTVTIEQGDFEGWSATARADFPARLIVDLNSGDLTKIFAVLEQIIVEHNMPDEQGGIAEHLDDVDPYTGLLAVSAAIGDALTKLPSR
jgi:hypothetical protein